MENEVFFKVDIVRISQKILFVNPSESTVEGSIINCHQSVLPSNVVFSKVHIVRQRPKRFLSSISTSENTVESSVINYHRSEKRSIF